MKKFTAYNKKQITGWLLYDFANTSFSVIIVTVVFAIYFKQYICGNVVVDFGGVEKSAGDFFWGLAGSASMIVVALSSPFMGALADLSIRKKWYLAAYTATSIVMMFSMFFLKPGMVFLAVLMFVIANIGFEGGIVFYNSYLPVLAPEEKRGTISGWGFAAGYVGSLFSLLIALPIAVKSMNSNDLALMRFAFPAAGAFFLVFSIPFFIWVKDVKRGSVSEAPLYKSVTTAYKRVLNTFKGLKGNKPLLYFLLAYFLYIDGVNTVVYFGGIYAKETLRFTMVEVIIFFAVIQSTAIAGSLVFGCLSDKIGPKRTILYTIIIWIAVCILAYIAVNKAVFYLVGLLAGIATGSIQASSRTLMSSLLPAKHETEFFGFYALCGKFSSVLGPLTFGVVSTLTGNQRYAILSLLLFFVTGAFFLLKVREPETKRT